MDNTPADDTDPTQQADRQILRLLVRAMWQQEWSAANPEGKAKDRAAAWKEVRAAETKARMKGYRKALIALRKSGVEITLSPAAKTEAEEG